MPRSDELVDLYSRVTVCTSRLLKKAPPATIAFSKRLREIPSMRGHVRKQQSMFVVVNLEEKVPADHPLRAIKNQADAILAAMRKDLAAAYCSNNGRPGIPPEQLLKAMLLRALYSIRSEIQLMQVIDYNMLYRWFLDLPLDAKVWTPEAFSVNRDRFEQHGLVRKFFDRIVAQAYQQDLASSDHFTVDGTLIRSWASDKSLVPRDPSQTPASERKDDDPGNPTVNFHNQKRSNATHVSTSDPEARLARKGSGKEAHLSHSGHVLMENRHGLVLDVQVEPADGTAERRAAQAMLKRVQRRHGQHPRTLGADSGYGRWAVPLGVGTEPDHSACAAARRADRLNG